MLNEITAVKELQTRLQLNDDDIAEAIGVHRVSWLRIKRTGKIGAQTKEKLIKVFPELRDIFFPAKATSCQHSGYNNPQPAPAAKPEHWSIRARRLVVKIQNFIKGS